MTSIQTSANEAYRGKTRFRGAITAVLASVVLSGCGVVNNMIYKTTGDVMQGFSRNHTVPYLLESDDLAMGLSLIHI